MMHTIRFKNGHISCNYGKCLTPNVINIVIIGDIEDCEIIIL